MEICAKEGQLYLAQTLTMDISFQMNTRIFSGRIYPLALTTLTSTDRFLEIF